MKFRDKLQLFPNSKYIIYSEFGPTVYGDSLDELINNFNSLKLNGRYDKTILITIINPDNISTVIDRSIVSRSIYDIELVKYAYQRNLIVSKDFSEIYGEYFELRYDDNYRHVLECMFDYNLLYGDFKWIKNGVYTSDFYDDMYDDLGDGIELKGKDFIIYYDESRYIDNFYTGKIVLGGVMGDSNFLRTFGEDYESFIPSALLKLKEE